MLTLDVKRQYIILEARSGRDASSACGRDSKEIFWFAGG
jgi:hypothetical protein